MAEPELLRALIWAKSYLELSRKHAETVCAGAVDEHGHPIRPYPVPLRYLQGAQQYRIGDIVEVRASRNPKDNRPESYRIESDSLAIVRRVPTDQQEWAGRRDVGRLIVEHEQGGLKRAAYGEAVLDDVSRRLTAEFGRRFTATNLRYMRQFYLAFPIHHALRDESGRAEKRNATRAKLAIHHPVRDESPSLRSDLSWTHYRLLLGVEDDRAREWYLHEAADQHWSTRQLERQIAALYYERLLASRKKAPVRKEAREKLAVVGPEEFIRDPYLLEFLDLKDYPALRESKVEQAIIDNLQAFLLELGKGFSFVARQKRMRFEEDDFYVDLVFYNYLLKCFVLIDLKVGALTHQDIGQMDSYVRMFDAHARPQGDNPTIGLILCSKKNEAVAKYSVLSEGKRLFAARYVKVLPTEAVLKRQIERERRLIESGRPAKREQN